MRLKTVINLILILILSSNEIYASQSMSIGYTPKYQDFKNFDYVNVNAKKGGDIIISAFGTFDSLNPFLLKSLSPSQMNNLVFDTLMYRSLDEPSSSYGLLAKSYKLSEDKLSVIFYLDETARFSNGDRVTSYDVKHTYDLLISKDAHPQYRIYWSDIESANIIDDTTIKFLFKKKNPELHMMIGDLPVFSKAWLDSNNFSSSIKKLPIASGPYRIKKYEIGKIVAYERNKSYWAKNKPVRNYMYNFDNIVIKYYKDMTVALEAFKAGEYDYIHENHSKRWARDYNGPNFNSKRIIKKELVHKNNAGIQGFAFNTRRDLFKNKDFRKAISLVFDFEWSNKNLFYNQYLRSYSYFCNSELSAKNEPSKLEYELAKSLNIDSKYIQKKISLPINNSPKEYRKSLIRAKNILDNLGYFVKDNQLYSPEGQKVQINFLLAQKGFERILAPFAHNLKRLGITLNYRTVDLSLYQRRLDNYNFDMTVVSYPQSQSPGSELISMFHSDAVERRGAFNFSGINNYEIDKIINEIVYSENREQMIVAAKLLDRLLWNEFYLIPNWFINTHRIAYYDDFSYPKKLPLFYQATNYILQTWSIK